MSPFCPPKLHAELTDTDKVQQEIDILYRSFIDSYETEPDYADCRIVYKDDGNEHDIKISLKVDDKSAAMEESIFYYCDCLSDFKSLAEYGCEDFILVGCYRFGRWTEEELSNNK